MKVLPCLFLIFIFGCSSQTSQTSLQYQLFSASVIHLQFEEDPADTIHLASYSLTNIPRDAVESNTLSVVEKGDYYLDLESDRPAHAVLKINKDQFNVVIFPEDTTHIMVKSGKKGADLSFAGKGAEINQYYQEKQQFLQYQDIRNPINQYFTSTATFNSIKHVVDSIVSEEHMFLERYVGKAQLPAWFVDYEKAEVTYAGADFKVSMPVYNKVFNRFSDTVPDNYFDFLGDLKINNPQAVHSGSYLHFLDSYFVRNAPLDSLRELAGLSRRNAFNTILLSESSKELNGEVKQLYAGYLLGRNLSYYSDPAEIDSLALAFGVTDYGEQLKIKGSKAAGGQPHLNLAAGDTVPNFYVTDQRDSLVSIRNFKDKIVYINFWASWCRPCIKNIPQLNGLTADFAAHEKVVFLNISLDKKKDKWQESIRQYELKGLHVVAEGNWHNKLYEYFNIAGIPHYVLLSKGNVLFENHTDKAPAVKSKISSLLEQESTLDLP